MESCCLASDQHFSFKCFFWKCFSKWNISKTVWPVLAALSVNEVINRWVLLHDAARCTAWGSGSGIRIGDQDRGSGSGIRIGDQDRVWWWRVASLSLQVRWVHLDGRLAGCVWHRHDNQSSHRLSINKAGHQVGSHPSHTHTTRHTPCTDSSYLSLLRPCNKHSSHSNMPMQCDNHHWLTWNAYLLRIHK